MAERLSIFGVLLWLSFLASSVYGHVALKIASRGHEAEGMARAWAIALSPWTLSGVLSWVFSGVLWLVLLDRYPLFEAMSVSSIRYALVLLAALVWLGESASGWQYAGMVLIGVGVLFVQGGK